jgi:hypothetical protein
MTKVNREVLYLKEQIIEAIPDQGSASQIDALDLRNILKYLVVELSAALDRLDKLDGGIV